MFTKEHIGRTVYDSVNYGKGMIVDFNDTVGYPIRVAFKDHQESYTIDGKLGEDDILPTLSFTPYTLEGYTNIAPISLPEIGEEILVSNNNEEWFVKKCHHVMKDNRIATPKGEVWEYYKRFKEIE